jgi:hypothetical protein
MKRHRRIMGREVVVAIQGSRRDRRVRLKVSGA